VERASDWEGELADDPSAVAFIVVAYVFLIVDEILPIVHRGVYPRW
jgi:hypothetical protein